ncbi:hypothetical protein P3X46_007260 [Hevea brasiliensis]|uniref:Retrotransposon gag domain-containing protein n=1 Tax=Hevea brasiliensis TaxID=3981 RepID=A0ABQ9MWN4_HEVBR|nr:hypothetical protein P3X46_007260 [Hevea brasiliensis]
MVKQKKEEILREYVARFNIEALQVSNIDNTKAIEGRLKGTISTKFFKSLRAFVSFSTQDDWGHKTPHDDALVIETIIHNFWVKKVLVDNGSKVNLVHDVVYQQLMVHMDFLIPNQVPINGQGRVSVLVERKVRLALTLKEEPIVRTQFAAFFVVKLLMPYNYPQSNNAI